MMKALSISAALCLVCAIPSYAQLSPPASTTVTIDGKTISIRYSAPSVRGRKIFGAGGLLSTDPTYPVWRAGANAATAFRTDADLDVGSLRVPRGSYTLFVLVKDPEAWELIVNKQTGQWGLDYAPSQDVGRIRMAMAKPPAIVERLKYTLTDKGTGKAELQLAWEHHVGTVGMTVR
jgi:DUF2911 family protein